MPDIIIRRIQKHDDQIIASIIRATLTEYGAARPGTVYYDVDTDRLSEIFTLPGTAYFIVELDGSVVGGAGIYSTTVADTCELVKMYLLPQARGLGIGKDLMTKCIEFASTAGYKNIYLETMPELKDAIRLYDKCGFEKLSGPLGNSGHHGCGIWMIKNL